ncbi:PAS domain-containing protein [Streptomyces mirabilis]
MDTWDELLDTAGPAALLTLDGVIRNLNAAMATALGKSAEQCLGRGFGDLWPASQRMSAESLVTHAAKTKAVAMRVLDFPARGGAPVASLIEARPVKDPASDEQLVWVHALDARNDLTSLLIPFRMATTAAHLGLWMYSPNDHQLEWLGGAPAVAALSVRQRVKPAYEDCSLTLSLYPEGNRRRLALIFRPDTDRIISNCYFLSGTVLRLPDHSCLNLYEPGTVRRLLDAAAPTSGLIASEQVIEVDGWQYFDAVVEALTAA